MRSHKSDSSGIPPLDAALPGIRLLGTAGFICAFNVTFRGPEFYHSEYPKAWEVEYERRNYASFDPVVLWSLMNVGDRRWSEITLADQRGVMAAARAHGMVYGAVFARAERGKKSVLTVARSDREFTDEEMGFLSITFGHVMSQLAQTETPGLTLAEIDTLRCVRDGLSYAEAAELLHIATPTVKARVDKARGKLGARNATQAVALALQRGLI